MSEKSVWGPIISTEELDDEDPIVKLRIRIQGIKNRPFKELIMRGVITLKVAEDRRDKVLQTLEMELLTIVYKRRQKKLFA